MNYTIKFNGKRGLSQEKIERVKECLKTGSSIREAGRKAGVSFYSAWHISKGSYENLTALKDQFTSKEFDWAYFSRII